jgi:hypothetical protein
MVVEEEHFVYLRSPKFSLVRCTIYLGTIQTSGLVSTGVPVGTRELSNLTYRE